MKSPNVLLAQIPPVLLLQPSQWKRLMSKLPPTELLTELGADLTRESPRAAAKRLLNEYFTLITPSSRPVLAKIADFGLSSVLYFDELEWNTDTQNPIWLAPEGLATVKADAYSFAIILYELVSCTVPYSDRRFDFAFQQQEAIYDGLRPQENISKSTPPSILDVMTRAWSLNPNDRPSFDEIVPIIEAALTTYIHDLSSKF